MFGTRAKSKMILGLASLAANSDDSPISIRIEPNPRQYPPNRRQTLFPKGLRASALLPL